MNKYLQILIGITTAVWLVIGVGIIAGVFAFINLPKIWGIRDHGVIIAPFIVEASVEFGCVERELGTEKARLIYQSGDAGEDAQRVEHCFK